MDNCFPSGELVSQDSDCFIDLQQTHIHKMQGYCNNTEDVLEDYLQNSFSQFLHIQDVKELANSCIEQSGMDVISSTEAENICGELKVRQTESPTRSYQKSFCKCATFPSSGKTSLAGSSGEEDGNPDATLQENYSLKSLSPDISRTASLPTPLKLVSAMKGSRDKEGIPLKKLNVTWAPDVYDPPPTIVSHTVRNCKKQQQSKNNRKNGKHKQKGKAVRGSNGKDKKQLRKIVGSGDRGFRSFEVRDKLIASNFIDSSRELEDFEVGSPDGYCGSSFLRKSVTKVHFSVAEAT